MPSVFSLQEIDGTNSVSWYLSSLIRLLGLRSSWIPSEKKDTENFYPDCSSLPQQSVRSSNKALGERPSPPQMGTTMQDKRSSFWFLALAVTAKVECKMHHPEVISGLSWCFLVVFFFLFWRRTRTDNFQMLRVTRALHERMSRIKENNHRILGVYLTRKNPKQMWNSSFRGVFLFFFKQKRWHGNGV